MHIELSTRPDEVDRLRRDVGDRRGRAARTCSTSEGTDYQLNPGDGAFYGPKIDFHIRDVMGRSWQCGTIQVDFAMPERLDITYTGADNEEHRPVMIHRAHAGRDRALHGHPARALRRQPADLARAGAGAGAAGERPPRRLRRARCVAALRAAGLRAELDDRSESVGKRIRDGQLQKVPYLLVVGDREAEARAVSVRERGEEKGCDAARRVRRATCADEVAERRLPGVEA